MGVQTVKKQSEMLFVRGPSANTILETVWLTEAGDSVVLIAPQEGVTQ